MKKIKEIELIDILDDALPEIKIFDNTSVFKNKEFDFFLCALGFEERCLHIPSLISKEGYIKCEHSIYFIYSTNSKDNKKNEKKLVQNLKTFSKSYSYMECDISDFTVNLRDIIRENNSLKRKTRILLDMSVCSSKLILFLMKVLLEYDIELFIVYTEADKYHPTPDDFENNRQKWTTEKGFGLARGVGDVVLSPEHPGLPDGNKNLIVVFPTFKPERTEKIITLIDDTILRNRPSVQIYWIIPDPHIDKTDRKKRREIIKAINKIDSKEKACDVSTLLYKKTIERLNSIYEEKNLDFHINISALGSKMQTLGIAIFHYIRPDVSIYFALPKEYNPKQYTEGCKATWMIEFGDLKSIKKQLDRVGQFEIVEN